MKTLAVLSFFRNSARNGQVTRFLEKVAKMSRHFMALQGGWYVRLIAVHGDSTDGTESALITEAGRLQVPLQLIRADHGGPEFGSVDTPERMRALSMICNRGLDAVRVDDEYVWYVESDLQWDAITVFNLLMELRVREHTGAFRQQPGLVAPLVFAGEAFYDIWGFRKNGHRFGPFHPYHEELKFDDLTYGMDSVGSCFVAHAQLMRECRIRDNNALVGFCDDVRAKGWTIAVDARKKVVHP